MDYRDEVFSQMAQHKNDLPEYMDTELEHVQELLRHKESVLTPHPHSRGSRYR
jgi:hypothetical protein